MKVRDRVAVVTGAASGIGAGLARELQRRGAKVWITDVDDAGLQRVASARDGGPAPVTPFHLDVRDASGWLALRETIGSPGPDLLFNNAGVSLNGPFLDCSIEDIDWQLDINLRGVTLGCKTFLPGMVARPEAHLVNVSSLFGIISMPESAAYCMSKHAVKALSECLMDELPRHVHVTSVHPGAVATAIVRSSRFMDGGRISAARAHRTIDGGLSPDVAARVILDAVESNRERVLVGSDARVIAALHRVAPWIQRRLVGWVLRSRR